VYWYIVFVLNHLVQGFRFGTHYKKRRIHWTIFPADQNPLWRNHHNIDQMANVMKAEQNTPTMQSCKVQVQKVKVQSFSVFCSNHLDLLISSFFSQEKSAEMNCQSIHGWNKHMAGLLLSDPWTIHHWFLFHNWILFVTI